jgi:IS5 family transposase
MEQLDYNLLFRWFVGLSMDDPIWDPTVFTKNRDRLFQGDIAQAFFAAVLTQARQADLVSAEHFTVDGTLLEAWASHKSVKPKDQPTPSPADADPGNPTVDFRGEQRSNATHRSTTDPDAQLVRKSRGQAAILGYRGHVLMENRHGLVVQAQATQVVGASEPATALTLATAIPGEHRATLGGDKGYDTADFVVGCRTLKITPHVAQNEHVRHRSAIDGRTTRHPGYTISQRCRKRVEEVFGWLKTVGQLRKLHHRGTALVNWVFLLRTTAYNLIRMRNLLEATA